MRHGTRLTRDRWAGAQEKNPEQGRETAFRTHVIHVHPSFVDQTTEACAQATPTAEPEGPPQPPSHPAAPHRPPDRKLFGSPRDPCRSWEFPSSDWLPSRSSVCYLCDRITMRLYGILL